VAPLRATLTDEERARDGARGNLLFVSTKHPSAALLRAPNAQPLPSPLPLDPTSAASAGFGGSAQHCPTLRVASAPLAPPPGGEKKGIGAVAQCGALGVVYEPPRYQRHSIQLVSSVTLPPIELSEHDKPQFSRDADMAVRNMANKFAGMQSGGGGGGGYGGGGGGRNQAAHRMIQGSLPLGTRR
jgi:hypothetical protein